MFLHISSSIGSVPETVFQALWCGCFYYYGEAMDHEVEMVVVAHHSKSWWEDALAGSVTKYLIDRSKLNVVVLH